MTRSFKDLITMFNKPRFVYEIGKERPDGKYNVWCRAQIKPQHWEWVIDRVCVSLEEAQAYVAGTKPVKTERSHQP